MPYVVVKARNVAETRTGELYFVTYWVLATPPPEGSVGCEMPSYRAGASNRRAAMSQQPAGPWRGRAPAVTPEARCPAARVDAKGVRWAWGRPFTAPGRYRHFAADTSH